KEKADLLVDLIVVRARSFVFHRFVVLPLHGHGEFRSAVPVAGSGLNASAQLSTARPRRRRFLRLSRQNEGSASGRAKQRQCGINRALRALDSVYGEADTRLHTNEISTRKNPLPLDLGKK